MTQEENKTVSENTDTTASEEQLPEVKIVLASASPRRRDLLKQAGVPFSICIAEIDEEEALSLENPHDIVQKLAEQKGSAVVLNLMEDNPKGLQAIIGADTVVAFNGEIFGKPRNIADATRMLSTLSGQTHQVYTGVALWLLGVNENDEVSVAYRSFVDVTDVTFKKLSGSDIASYLREGESFDKAGAYAAQGKGARLIQQIDGDIDTVIGLPVKRLLTEFSDIFRAAGVSVEK